MNGWSIDKRIPIPMILALFIQTGAFIWYAAKLDSRVGVLEARAQTLPLSFPANLEPRLVTLEAQYGEIMRALVRIEKKLDE